ncbi:hypothetical protein KFK09_022762 [Dendrobium nobile]|uniref:Expansin-like EG45 domain-containing protein n=1 Tax=Dendrobium nobile TaxID=94219 RepID=A0A8T3AQT4_DENNO|nr:hypothetical protein KFK09_022762 [Dendrobium nobile]
MGTRIAAASEVIWDDGRACGRKYTVTCTGATNDGVLKPCTRKRVNITITDLCPDPVCQGTIDLSLKKSLK